jgi:two-component system sensor histidine kinase UhpB
MLFRIVQEALTNVARHAAASAVEIRAWQEKRQLVLEVEDDGIGIGEQAGSRGPSWGLRGMQERARYLGGTLELRARQGGGTLLRLTMPLGTVSAIANT